MSFNPTFKGTVNSTLWQNDTVQAQSGNPPTPPATDLSQIRSMTQIYQQPINWSGNVPPELLISGTNITDIVNKFPTFELTLNYVFTATSGSTYNCVASGPATKTAVILLYLDQNPYLQINNQGQSGCIATFGTPTSTVNISITSQSTLNTAFFVTIISLPWVQDISVSNSDINNYTLNLTVEISLSLPCISSDLQSGICLDYCLLPSNINTSECLSAYQNYCFGPTGPTGSNIVVGSTGPTGPIQLLHPIFDNDGDNGCNTYFSAYISKVGSNRPLDSELTSVCSIYNEIVDKFDTAPPDIQNICACHLPSGLYQNIQTSLTQAVPGLGGLLDIPAVCWLPACVNSVYKPTGISTCPTIPCLDIVAITNNGTINNTTAKINQINNCLNKSKDTVYLIAGGVVILIIIIVVFILFIMVEKERK